MTDEEIIVFKIRADKVKSHFSLYPLRFIMTKAQADALKTLKKHTLNLLNNILPMEKNIRKIALKNPESFAKLKELNQDIKSFWIEKGLTQAEIKDSHILELSWDKLQFGSNGKYDPKIMLHEDITLILKENLKNLIQEFSGLVRALEFDDAPEYCYFNLANGNNLQQLLVKFAKTKSVIDDLTTEAAKLKNQDKQKCIETILLKGFIRGIQEPLPYQSSSSTIMSGRFSIHEKDQEQPRVVLDIRVEPELGNLKRIIIDFIKSYIEIKNEHITAILNSEDALAYKYVNDSSLRDARKLLAELRVGQFLDDGINYNNRLDSLQKEIISLILWDFKQTKVTDEKTIDKVLDLMRQLNATIPELANYEFVKDESLDKYLSTIKREMAQFTNLNETIAD